jgi:molybdate transport system substrate-binding protein
MLLGMARWFARWPRPWGQHHWLLLSLAALLLFPLRALAAESGEARVAVAANFAGAMQTLAAEFSKDTGNRVQIVPGATGTLYAQIENGSPIDVFLAADQETPKKLEAEGLAVTGSRFTYARGRLVVWSARPGFVDPAGDVLRVGRFQHLAIANPKVAPYGQAAMEVLAALGLTEATRPKLVQGENVGQTAQFVSSGAAELGFVALSQISGPTVSSAAGPRPTAASSGSSWVVPERLYSPIRQDAVLLKRAAANAAARDLLAYLQSPRARDVIRSFGYAVEAAPASATAPLPGTPRGP